MIQRIQSLYLLMAGIVSAICAYLCLGGILDGQFIPALTSESLNFVGGALCIIVTLDSLTTVFFYKNRKSQMAMCWSIILTAIIAALFYVWILVAVPFVYLAWRGIRADERLIRSIDRIR